MTLHRPSSPESDSTRPASNGHAHQDTSALTSGAFGREIYFRPNRYDPDALAPLDVRVLIPALGDVGEARLRNLSQSGLGVVWPTEAALPAEGGALPGVQVLVDGRPIATLDAKVVSLQPGRIVGLELQGALLRIDALLAAQRVAQARERARGAEAFGRAPWADVAADAFKARVAELATYLQRTRAEFDAIEQELGWDIVHAPVESEAYGALIDLISREFVPTILRFCDEIDAARRLADPARDKDLEAYSRAMVHPAMIEAPWMRRALDKPFGYPGDYELMRYVYERPFEGPTLFAKAMAYAFLQSAAACAVRERKNLILRQLTALMQGWDKPDQKIRLLSIAAGPAQEVYELLRDRDHMPAPVEIVLFDQDANALAYAYGRIKTLVDTKWRGRVQVTFLHEGIRALIKNPAMFEGVGLFDGVICCGLYDYLNDKVAAGLTAKLYSVLREGGEVWIGNMVPENPCRWFMEHHQDWRLLYRTREEILAFARAGVPSAEHRILEEPTGVNPFVAVRRN
ncbi:MAG: class I SAM-dependent methyltransferase [Deltaproteobacteria bacterium]|nr:class I SAM-dependent methyltransferase [Deltaproteobacteria bacterium]